MPMPYSHRFVSSILFLLCSVLSLSATAQQSPFFAPGNVVVAVEGCGVQGGTCTVTNGTGNGPGNSSNGGYGARRRR